ncbi:hypothetical protein QE152_g31002 [Popillia japonica]|uniref:Uncharacterized protein n=1 Tax=Popillia japonica TaxID=7064 RepID=A0AAW1JCZ6_POPJA
MKRSFAILLFLCLSLIYIESRPSDDGTEQAADVSSGEMAGNKTFPLLRRVVVRCLAPYRLDRVGRCRLPA